MDHLGQGVRTKDKIGITSLSKTTIVTDDQSVTSQELTEHQSQYNSYLILSNIGKRQNFGTLLRSAAAFGVAEVFIVGEKKLKTFGNQGTTSHLRLTNFPDFATLRFHLDNRAITVCGIEIVDSAVNVAKKPFTGNTAFMLGNEGTGMTERQIKFCDQFVYISQYSKATASLNVAIAGSIVLHYFAEWAGMSETARNGQKFEVKKPRSSLEAYLNPTQEERELRKSLQQIRMQKKEQGYVIE